MTNLLAAGTDTDFTNVLWEIPTGQTLAQVTADAGYAPDGSLTASLIIDNETLDVQSLAQAVTIPANTLTYCFAGLIRKTSGAGCFPAIDIRFSGGELCSMVINTDTGGVTARTVDDVTWFAPISMECVSWNSTYWLAWVTLANTGCTQAVVYISPAFNANASGTYDYTTLGNNTWYQAYFEQNTVSTLAIPQASFSFTTTYLSVSFTDTTAANPPPAPTSWSWNFGDSGTSTLQNPTHVYAAAGTYAVSMTATNQWGSSTTDQNVTVTAAPAPTAAFTVFPATVAAGVPMVFTDASSADPTAWAWSFGDGSGSTYEDPAHTYASPGVYRVSLIASNAGGSSEPFYLTITVTPACPQIQDDLVFDNMLPQSLQLGVGHGDGHISTAVVPPSGRAIVEGARLQTMAPNVRQVLIPQKRVRVSAKGVAPATAPGGGPTATLWLPLAVGPVPSLTGDIIYAPG